MRKLRNPDYCFTTDGEGNVVKVVRGQRGFHPTMFCPGNHDLAQRTADRLNQKNGIIRPQVYAMVTGAIFGWDTPAADPNVRARRDP